MRRAARQAQPGPPLISLFKMRVLQIGRDHPLVKFVDLPRCRITRRGTRGEAMRARRRQGEDQRDTLANAAILPSSMTFRAMERWRDIRRQSYVEKRSGFIGGNARSLGHRRKMICASKRPSNRNVSGCSFRFNNRRGTIDVDVSDAMNELSLFVVQIRRLDVTYNHSNATCHRYIRLTMQNCHPI